MCANGDGDGDGDHDGKFVDYYYYLLVQKLTFHPAGFAMEHPGS
jgi:hypothetical protein